MKRRSFLQLLGFAPAAAALPAFTEPGLVAPDSRPLPEPVDLPNLVITEIRISSRTSLHPLCVVIPKWDSQLRAWSGTGTVERTGVAGVAHVSFRLLSEGIQHTTMLPVNSYPFEGGLRLSSPNLVMGSLLTITDLRLTLSM